MPLEQSTVYVNPVREIRTQRGFACLSPSAAAYQAEPAGSSSKEPCRIPRAVRSPSPFPGRGAQVRRQTTGSSPLQRLPGKLLISTGSSRIHLITVTGSEHSPHPRLPLPQPARASLQSKKAAFLAASSSSYPKLVLMNWPALGLSLD